MTFPSTFFTRATLITSNLTGVSGRFHAIREHTKPMSSSPQRE